MRKRKAWNPEIYRELDANFKKDDVLINQPIQVFLQSPDKLILVGAKGLGKTLFLRYKSHQYRELYDKSILYNQETSELTENLSVQTGTFSKEDLLNFQSEHIWRTVWELTLWVSVFRVNESPIPEGLEKLVGKSALVSNILSRVLNNRNKIDAFKEYILDLQEMKTNIRSGVALFLDDLDQALEDILQQEGKAGYIYTTNTTPPATKVWMLAQMGLVRAIYNISRQNSHIKIHTTIRREAYEAYEGELKANFGQHISVLGYDKNEIREIFYKNISFMESHELLNPTVESPCVRFIGYEKMPHPFVKDLNNSNESRTEHVFDFIYRHTLGRPREIINMGEKISALISQPTYRKASFKDQSDSLRLLVNQEGHKIYEQYTQEIVPDWDKFQMAALLETAGKNVFPSSNPEVDEHIIRYYFNLGLLGYVRTNSINNHLVQIFQPAGTYNYQQLEQLPKTDYYLIHSVLDSDLIAQHTYGNFYDDRNIVGNGYPFYEPQKLSMELFQPEDYYPGKVSGKRWNAGNEAGGHDEPLSDLYTRFFSQDEAGANRTHQLQGHMEELHIKLGRLGRLCCCQRLINVVADESRAEQFKAETTQLLSDIKNIGFQLNRGYNSFVTEETLYEKLLDRMLGRYVTIACYLILDMRIEWIHRLLTEGIFSFEIEQDETKKNSAFSYLNRCFYIYGLKKEEPRNPSSEKYSLTKKKVYSNLSRFEQENISNFFKRSREELSFLNWLNDPDDLDWVNKNILELMWDPQSNTSL